LPVLAHGVGGAAVYGGDRTSETHEGMIYAGKPDAEAF